MVVVREQEVYLILFENTQLDHMIEFKLSIMEISMRLSLKISTQSDENIAPLIWWEKSNEKIKLTEMVVVRGQEVCLPLFECD